MTDDSLLSWIQTMSALPERLECELPGRWAGFEALPKTDSTNARLLESEALVATGFSVCVAREQTAGRGRRGRNWVASRDSGLTFSLARALKPEEPPTPALTLAIGVGLARGLSRCGLAGFGFKWPNDLVTRDGAKLAGILVEARPKAPRRAPALVAGVGLNVRGAAGLGLERPVADLSDLSGSPTPDPADLLRAILVELVRAWETFALHGLPSVLADYRRLDYLFGRPVRVLESNLRGVAEGVDPVDGALLLRSPEGLQRLYSGDVSVRRMGDV